MNTNELSDSDAALHDVEMSVRRKQAEPLVKALTQLGREMEMCAMFSELVELASIAHGFVLRSYERQIAKRDKAVEKKRDRWIEEHEQFITDRRQILDRMEAVLERAEKLL